MAHEQEKPQGALIISLDLELYWGMFDKATLKQYGAHIRGVHEVVPEILALFQKHDMHATWAAVGMMSYANRAELAAALPPEDLRPNYPDPTISSYHHLASGGVGDGEVDDPYHFGESIIRQILATPGQELGSHTFSHYYALEGGQGPEHWKADLEAAAAALSRFGTPPTSLVFPRNQINEGYLGYALDEGITAVRTTQDHALYRPKEERAQVALHLRAGRFLDRYLNLTGHHTFTWQELGSVAPFRLPASRQLVPYSRLLALAEPLKRQRIELGLTHAAHTGRLFHLWWHPHNFGVNQTENLAGLEELLDYAALLRERYGFASLSMAEAVARVRPTEHDQPSTAQ
ncbi:polysaccharide deacetylase family protein [Patescibacteria group bacterium]|jgi:peptidoglycan/xylan/chitin deacetylase (PgdA/CDA1 family)|nr:polysaccharide deacetylase family protein [Patescibacteria group bacterium]